MRVEMHVYYAHAPKLIFKPKRNGLIHISIVNKSINCYGNSDLLYYKTVYGKSAFINHI